MNISSFSKQGLAIRGEHTFDFCLFVDSKGVKIGAYFGFFNEWGFVQSLT